MSSSLLCLGQFVFALNSVPYQSLQHQRAWRHPANPRVGLRPAHQFIGPDEETITLQGVLLPEITGGEAKLDELDEMAESGDDWVLIDGAGNLLGLFVIEGIDRTKTLFFQDGKARRIEFTLKLTRVDDDAVARSSATDDEDLYS